LRNVRFCLAVLVVTNRSYGVPVICTPEELMGEYTMWKDPIVEEAGRARVSPADQL